MSSRLFSIYRFTGNGNNFSTLTPGVSSQFSPSTANELTSFSQVQGDCRRRPAMISLNVQWIPVTNSSGTYQWSGNDISNQKVKKVTFFGIGKMREPKESKVITPPSSDYTDAYLSAFASKPIPTRYVHRLSTTVFDSSTPISLKPITVSPLSANDSTKTSQTRFISINNIQPLNTFDKPVSSSSSRSSTYSSSFTSERSTAYEPVSITQYSSAQCQTLASNFSTLLHTPTSTVMNASSSDADNQRSCRTFQSFTQPLLSKFPAVYRSETFYKDVYKPLPPYSLKSYPPSNIYNLSSLSPSTTESTYKTQIPFQSTPLSLSAHIDQSNINQPVIGSSTKTKKQIDRPETMLFQYDEDSQSSRIEKTSPIWSPSFESPISRKELINEPESLHTEKLLDNSSEPIRILENNLNKYDLLINQISEVLASVSPLSSTVSSMSPDKSVLDYQLSSDSSPILLRKRLEMGPSQQSTTTTVKSSVDEQMKPSYLIRDDSYDKIVDAISDIDNEIRSSTDIQSLSTAIKDENQEEKSSSLDESHVRSSMEDEYVKSSIQLPDAHHSLLRTESEKKELEPLPKLKEEANEKEISWSDRQLMLTVSEEKEEKEEILQTTLTDKIQAQSVAEEEPEISQLEEHQTSQTKENEKNDEVKIVPIDEQLTTTSVEDIKDDKKMLTKDEQQTSSIIQKVQKIEANASGKDDRRILFATQEEKGKAECLLVKNRSTPTVNENEIAEVLSTLADECQISSISKEEWKEGQVKTLFTDDYRPHLVIEGDEKEEGTTISTDAHLDALALEDSTPKSKSLSSDDYQLPLLNMEEKAVTETLLVEGHQVMSVIENENVKVNMQSSDKRQFPWTMKEEIKVSLSQNEQKSSDTSVNEMVPSSELKLNEEKVVDVQSTAENKTGTVQFCQQQTDVVTIIANDIVAAEEREQAFSDLKSTKIFRKHVTWNETVMNNVDENEDPLCENVTEESHASEVSTRTTIQKNGILAAADDEFMIPVKLTSTVDQRIKPPDVTNAQISSDTIINPLAAITISTVMPNVADQQIALANVIDMQSTTVDTQGNLSNYSKNQNNLQVSIDGMIHRFNTTEQPFIPFSPAGEQEKIFNSLELSSNLLNSTNQKIISSDLAESQATFNKSDILLASPIGTQSISVASFSKEDIFTVGEMSPITSDIISKEDVSKPMEEFQSNNETKSKEEMKIDSHTRKHSSQIAGNLLPETAITVVECTTQSLQPQIVSFIDALADRVANRYISSDVYYGYLGEHSRFVEVDQVFCFQYSILK